MIDRESLRPAFERYVSTHGWPVYRDQHHYKHPTVQSLWDGFNSAFESLGEPAGYVCTTGHGTAFVKRPTPEQLEIRHGGEPVWNPVYRLPEP